MKILFLHGLGSTVGGVKPTFLVQHGHTVLNPKLPDDDFDAAVKIAQDEFDRTRPDIVVGSSRGGAVAMNIDSGSIPLVLLCPAWKRWGTATTIKPNTVILHSKADEVVPFADSQELLRNSNLPDLALIVVGHEHRLVDEESLKKMVEVVERGASPMFPPDLDYIKAMSSVLKEMDDELPLGIRDWLQHAGYRSGHDEVAITGEISRRLTGRNLMSKGQRYPLSRQSCDIVSSLAGGKTVWVEAKVYWTVYFDGNDPGRTKLRVASDSQTWQARIEALVSDCSDKLLKLLPARTQVGVAALRNYQTLCKSWFSRSLASYNFYIMPIGFSYDFRTLKMLEVQRTVPVIANLIKSVTEAQERAEKGDGTFYFACEIATELKSAKKFATGGDLTVRIDQNAKEGAVVITQTKKKLDVYPLSYTELVQNVKRQVPGVKTGAIDGIIKSHKVKSNPDLAAYSFRTKMQEDAFVKGGKLPKGITSIYKEEAVRFIIQHLQTTKPA